MENEDLNTEVEEIVDAPEVKDGEEETTDYKALALKNAGIAKRYKTKLEKANEPKVVKPEVVPQIEKKGFDYGEMAYLEAKGISDEDYPIVLEAMKSTGKSLRDAVGNKFIQAEIKEAKEARETKEAIPSGSKRSVSATRDTKEYWIAKGELPPNTPENRKLRQDVVNARMAKEKDVSMFAN